MSLPSNFACRSSSVSILKMVSFLPWISAFVCLYYATQSASQSSVTSVVSPMDSVSSLASALDNVTLITTTSGSSTWIETFTGTSLTQFSAITTPTSVTMTNAADVVVAGIVVAGGLAWVGLPSAGAPVVDAPTAPPQLTAEQSISAFAIRNHAITGQN